MDRKSFKITARSFILQMKKFSRKLSGKIQRIHVRNSCRNKIILKNSTALDIPLGISKMYFCHTLTIFYTQIL